MPLAPVKIVARGYIAREMTPSEVYFPTPHQEVISEHREATDGQAAGLDANQDASTSAKPVRQKKSARAPKRGKRDTRRHEHLITEKGKDLETAQMDDHDQSMTPDPDMAIKPETAPTALEIGAVDQELEQTQIVL